MARLPYDVWTLVFTDVDDQTTLASCAQVSRTLCDAATRRLYHTLTAKQVLRYPEVRPFHCLYPLASQGLQVEWTSGSQAIASHRSDLRAHVRTVRHRIQVMSRRESGGPSTTDDCFAFLAQLPNLTSYTLDVHTTTYGLATFIYTSLLNVLSQCVKLTDVTWNVHLLACSVPIVMRARPPTLRALTFSEVPRYVEGLRQYLLSFPQLEELHIRSFAFFKSLDLMDELVFAEGSRLNLKKLTLGKHSLSGLESLVLLNRMPSLEHVDIEFVSSPQNAVIETFADLPRLRKLVVRYANGARFPVESMFDWICAVAATSPLEDLDINAICKPALYHACPSPSTLAKSLPSLRTLHMEQILLDDGGFSSIVQGCNALTDMSFRLASEHDYLRVVQRSQAVGYDLVNITSGVPEDQSILAWYGKREV
ncbi:hypothetical protein BV25DRAFT_1364563 [Artomyces pyxidatus]|uniref:Uncharacterized protein n=1 Tax=Artomyces pyxidatus TaxID=48021 RepID=A0ACB8SP54_9AGAM|nr:hypothetical protein BV25DRAFT_1364563 [Artomyces pyxidatus]